MIPEVVGPVVSARTGEEREWKMPDRCPFCGNPIVRPEGEKVARCTGGFSCPSRVREWLFHFASRGGMDIEGLGYQTIDLLMSKGWVKDPADIFTFDVDRLKEVEGWGDKSVENLRKAIEEAKKRPAHRLLTALGIRHVGATVARRLLRRFGSIPALLDASEDEIAAVDGVGPVIARSVAEWAADPENRKLVERLQAAGVNMEEETTTPGAGLEGVTLVITGTLSGYTREEAEAEIERRGGVAAGSVSRRTTALVVGADPGTTKLRRAEELGIPIIDEETFQRLLTEGRSVLDELTGSGNSR
ncbi:MAG: hypothetical protein KatS3mg011_2188 [Acidimicrobiia bacterium]|nr:MAG: hypothetical protein KatS3mg011_2188 [Acidimicrobiia bacterium]